MKKERTSFSVIAAGLLPIMIQGTLPDREWTRTYGGSGTAQTVSKIRL